MSAVSSVCSNFAAVGATMTVDFTGGIWCPIHNQVDWCYGSSSGGAGVVWDPNTWTVPYTPGTGIGTGSGQCVPTPFVFTPTVLECALCDNALEMDDKKICKSCKGVLDAWKFLSKKDEPEEK